MRKYKCEMKSVTFKQVALVDTYKILQVQMTMAPKLFDKPLGWALIIAIRIIPSQQQKHLPYDCAWREFFITSEQVTWKLMLPRGYEFVGMFFAMNPEASESWPNEPMGEKHELVDLFFC